MLTAAEIRNTQFALTRRHPGYDPEDVDVFLARAEAEVDRLIRENDELRGSVPRPLPSPGAAADPLTPADVRNPRFAMTQGYPGYEPSQVDAFLARTQAELEGLVRENQELRGITPPPQVTTRAGRVSRSGARHARPGGPADGEPFKLTIICALVFLAVAVGCGFGMASLHAGGERSAFTQSSGIAETATVTGVTTTGPKNPQTDISVLLGTPVDYQFVSDVHVPGDHSYDTGDKIRILVDPRDPSIPAPIYFDATPVWTCSKNASKRCSFSASRPHMNVPRIAPTKPRGSDTTVGLTSGHNASAPRIAGPIIVSAPSTTNTRRLASNGVRAGAPTTGSSMSDTSISAAPLGVTQVRSGWAPCSARSRAPSSFGEPVARSSAATARAAARFPAPPGPWNRYACDAGPSPSSARASTAWAWGWRSSSASTSRS